MATMNSPIDMKVSFAHPNVRTIGVSDLREALTKGLGDFRAMPTHSLFLIGIYPIVGLILLRLTFGYDLLPLVFPLVAGFALLGPLAAFGLYELSRRREQVSSPSLASIPVSRSSQIWDIAGLGVVLLLIFFAWLAAAMAIYQNIFGGWTPASFQEFARQVFTTSSGWRLIITGCAVGFIFALTAFTLSVVSFPMLVDRDVGLPEAVITSIRTVVANPVTMALWGLIVASGLLLGSLPFLLGLSVVLPVLGHSTWHLYRKVVQYQRAGEALKS